MIREWRRRPAEVSKVHLTLMRCFNGLFSRSGTVEQEVDNPPGAVTERGQASGNRKAGLWMCRTKASAYGWPLSIPLNRATSF